MKKTIYLLAAATWLTLSGCEKELDQNPLSSGSTPTFYRSQADFDQALAAAYQPLTGYASRALNLSETRSDNIYGVDDLGVRDWAPVNNFSTALVNNPYVAEAWTTNYRGIFRVNTVLDQLAANGSVVSDAARPRLEGEAKFLRAFYYFDLVRFFGKVPIYEAALLPDAVAKIPRSPVEDVYKLIISDLQAAISSLPATYDNAVSADKPNVGRATANAAKSLLALVYLTRSGPTYGIEGPGLNTNEYSLALPLLNDVLNSGKYSFLASYPDIFSYTNENNREVVFDIQFQGGGTGLGSDFPGLLVPDAYFTFLKIPYASGGLEIRPIANDLLNSYAAGDVRKTFNFAEGYVSTTGFRETRWLMKKYLNENLRGPGRLDWPINWIVLRYTDLLMMKAECILHGVGGTQTDVDNIVNQVRARAGVTTKLTNVTLPQLMEERRRELAGEGSRWHDLVREGLVLTRMNAWIPVEDTRNRMRRNIDATQIIYPVPQSELSAAPGLYEQNAGY